MNVRSSRLAALAVGVLATTGASWAADTPDPLCAPLRTFVSAVAPGESREFTFHTVWGSNFKDEPAAAVFARRCEHHGDGAAAAVCTSLMDQGAVEASERNAVRTLACLDPQMRLERVRLERGTFSLTVGTQARGSNVQVDYDADAVLGGMALRVTARGY
jgi:hypothetical protein